MTDFTGNLAHVAGNELIEWKRVPQEGEFDAFVGLLGKLEIRSHQQPIVRESISIQMNYTLRARRLATSFTRDGNPSEYTSCAFINGSEARRVYDRLDTIL